MNTVMAEQQVSYSGVTNSSTGLYNQPQIMDAKRTDKKSLKSVMQHPSTKVKSKLQSSAHHPFVTNT